MLLTIYERGLKWLETEFSIAICRRTGNKWQLKALFLVIFDPNSSIIKSVFDCRLSCVLMVFLKVIFETLILKINRQHKIREKNTEHAKHCCFVFNPFYSYCSIIGPVIKQNF